MIVYHGSYNGRLGYSPRVGQEAPVATPDVVPVGVPVASPAPVVVTTGGSALPAWLIAGGAVTALIIALASGAKGR